MKASEFYKKFPLKSREERRSLLIASMNQLSKKNINCFSCTGKCCTFQANSMQIDPLQALELYFYLVEQGRWSKELIGHLEENISHFRLDRELLIAKGETFRRYYTCPFFEAGAKGCSIAPEAKPYGCLAFNPLTLNAQGGKDCGSDLDLLEEREKLNQISEDQVNQFLKEELGVSWNKKPIPVALLEVARGIGEIS